MGPGDNTTCRIDGRSAVQPDHVRAVEDIGRFRDEFELHAFAQRKQAGVPDVEFRRAWGTQGVAAYEQRTLECAGRRWIAIQHTIATHVEHVAALNRRDHREEVAVYQIPERPAAALQFRRVNEIAIERMPPISQRIAAISPTVGRIRQEEVGAVDVVLFRRVIDGMGPCVGREHLEPSREAFGQSKIEAVVDGLANRLCGEDVAKAREYARRTENWPAVSQLLSGRYKVDIPHHWQAVASREQICGRERQVSGNFSADRHVRIPGIQACEIRADSRDVLESRGEALRQTGKDGGKRRARTATAESR